MVDDVAFCGGCGGVEARGGVLGAEFVEGEAADFLFELLGFSGVGDIGCVEVGAVEVWLPDWQGGGLG